MRTSAEEDSIDRPDSLIESPLFVAIALPAMLVAWQRWRDLPRWAQRSWLGLSALMIATFAFRAVSILEQRFADRAVWDFFGFWVQGRAAWLGLDFYDSEVMRSILPFPPGPGWEYEVLAVGSVYPPFTSFLFAPFGAFSYETAYFVWCVANAAVAASACWLAGRTLFREQPHGWVVAALILVLLPASLYTAHVQQSSFLILLLSLAVALHGDSLRAGVWIALAVVVKPLAALLVLHPAGFLRWRVLIGGALAGVVLVSASALLWGPDKWLHFAEHPPSESLAAHVTADPVNQSIGARMSRHFGWHERGERMTAQPLFLGLAAAMTLATLGAFARRRRDGMARSDGDPASDDGIHFGLAAAVALALVIYPASKQHYGVLLALPAWLLWSARDRLPRYFPREAAAVFIGATWALCADGSGGRSWAVFLLWWGLMTWLVAVAPAVRREAASQ